MKKNLVKKDFVLKPRIYLEKNCKKKLVEKKILVEIKIGKKKVWVKKKTILAQRKFCWENNFGKKNVLVN